MAVKRKPLSASVKATLQRKAKASKRYTYGTLANFCNIRISIVIEATAALYPAAEFAVLPPVDPFRFASNSLLSQLLSELNCFRTSGAFPSLRPNNVNFV